MDDAKRLELIAEAVRYCQRVRSLGMPPSCYSKALREPVYFLWERKAGPKAKAARYRSKATIGLQHGKGLIVYDHAIPFNYLQQGLLDLDPITPQGIAETLSRFGVTALITREEDTLLNKSGYRHRMPQDWDGINPLARYEAVGIEMIGDDHSS